MNLKEARKSKEKLKEFLKEHEKDPKGDKETFEKALGSMTHPQKSKSTQGTSSQGSSES